MAEDREMLAMVTQTSKYFWGSLKKELIRIFLISQNHQHLVFTSNNY